MSSAKVGFAVLEAFGRGEELHGVPGADLGDTGDDEGAAAGLGILRDFNSIPNQYLSRAGSRDTAATGSLSQQLPNPYFRLTPSYTRTITREICCGRTRRSAI